MVTDGTVACFHHAQERACFLHFPELAHTEREMFELLWRRAKEPPTSAEATAGRPTQAQTVAVTLPAKAEPLVPLSTRSLSSLREFFLSRKSVAVFTVSALLAGGITWGLWRHTNNINLQRVRDQVIAIAATAAPEFEAEDLDQLHTWQDTEKPVYHKVVEQLQDIRNRNPKVRYTYIIRSTSDPYFYQFVADANSLDIRSFPDSTEDGLRNDVNPPGYIYYDNEGLDSSFYRALREPDADYQPCYDLWGVWISGHAPIRDAQGNTVAIIGVDIDAREIKSLSEQAFPPALIFIGLFLLFVFIRLAAFNRSLFLELLGLLKSKNVLLFLGICALIALGVTYGMYRYTLSLMKEQIGEKLMAIASTASAEIDVKDLEPLRFARDMKRPEYQRVFKKLNEIRDKNEGVTWVDIIRPTQKPNIWEFVADADVNYNLPLFVDRNKNGIGEEDEAAPPGTQYDASGQNISRSEWDRPMFEWFYDQWGYSVTGSAPIRDVSQKAVAVLDVAMDVTSFYEQIQNKFVPYFWFSTTFIGLFGLWAGYLFSRAKH